MSEPSLSEQKKNRLLEIGATTVVLGVWALSVLRGTTPPEGIVRWLLLSVGPVSLLEICYASWKYLQLTRQSPDA